MRQLLWLLASSALLWACRQSAVVEKPPPGSEGGTSSDGGSGGITQSSATTSNASGGGGMAACCEANVSVQLEQSDDGLCLLLPPSQELPSCAQEPSLWSVFFHLDDGSSPRELTQVAAPGICNVDDDKFYIETDPLRLVMCPATCTQLQAHPDGELELRASCPLL